MGNHYFVMTGILHKQCIGKCSSTYSGKLLAITKNSRLSMFRAQALFFDCFTHCILVFLEEASLSLRPVTVAGFTAIPSTFSL